MFHLRALFLGLDHLDLLAPGFLEISAAEQLTRGLRLVFRLLPPPLARRLPLIYRTTLFVGIAITVWAYWNR